MSDNGDIIKHPGKYKAPPSDDGPMLVPVPWDSCKHYDGQFEIDEDSGDAKCLQCGERVTAIFVLKRLMGIESRWMRTRASYQDEMKRLNSRSRTKCQHCQRMTRISSK